MTLPASFILLGFSVALVALSREDYGDQSIISWLYLSVALVPPAVGSLPSAPAFPLPEEMCPVGNTHNTSLPAAGGEGGEVGAVWVH